MMTMVINFSPFFFHGVSQGFWSTSVGNIDFGSTTISRFLQYRGFTPCTIRRKAGISQQLS